MTNRCIIPIDHPIGVIFRQAVRERKVIFVAGLPSSGKSLMLQQLTILADQASRRIHTMQWDSLRRSFETEEALKKYPELDDLTHAGIRKAVGLWVRKGVQNWVDQYRNSGDILIAELPVVGGRFVELLQPMEDETEGFLKSDEVLFVVPVPNQEMREVITGRRAETFANPRNEQETKDAPIYIVQNDWITTRQLYNSWHEIENSKETDSEYSREIYSHVFNRLLRFRQFEILDVDQPFGDGYSAYERPVAVTELTASDVEVSAAYAELDRLFPGQKVETATDSWSEY